MPKPKRRQKTKRDTTESLNRYLFMVLWMLASMVGALLLPIVAEWVINIMFSLRAATISDSYLFRGVITGMLLGISAVPQWWLIKRAFGHDIRGWIPLSWLGWIIGSLAAFSISESMTMPLSSLDVFLQVNALMLPVALAQWALLRRHIQGAWMWLLTAVAASGVFNLVLEPTSGSDMNAMWSFGAFALVTGLILIGMMSNARNRTAPHEDNTTRAESAHGRLQTGSDDDAPIQSQHIASQDTPYRQQATRSKSLL